MLFVWNASQKCCTHTKLHFCFNVSSAPRENPDTKLDIYSEQKIVQRRFISQAHSCSKRNSHLHVTEKVSLCSQYQALWASVASTGKELCWALCKPLRRWPACPVPRTDPCSAEAECRRRQWCGRSEHQQIGESEEEQLKARAQSERKADRQSRRE